MSLIPHLVRYRRTVAALLALLAVVAVHSRLFGGELANDTAKLFDLGAKNTPAALVAAKTQYEHLKRANPQDRRIDYAYGVVLANQHRYHDALPLLSRYLESGEPTANAYCVKIWTQFQDRRYADALDELLALSKRLPRDPNAEMEPECEEAAHFMGTMFGYLELARPGVIDPELKSKRKSAVLAELGDRYVPAFDQGRNAVAARLTDVRAKRQASQGRLAAIAHEQTEQDKADLEENRRKIALQKEVMQSHAEQSNEAERELNVVQTQLASLQNDRVQVGARIIFLRANISAVLALPAPPPVPAPPPIEVRDPTPPIVITKSTQYLQAEVAELRTRYGTDYQALLQPANARAAASQAERDGPRYDYMSSNAMTAYALSKSLTVLNKQAFDIDRQILALQQRAAELAGKGQQAAQSLAEREAVVQKAAKHAKVIEKKLAREEAAPPKASTAVLTSQMTSLSTYLPFPYEQEKQRVLGWFEKK